MITDSMFVIAVPDLKQSAQFYTDVMGFEASKLGDPGWRLYVKN